MMSDNPRLNEHENDEPCESINLNQHENHDLRELNSSNRHESDYPLESNSLNQHDSDDPCESTSLNQHENHDPRESIRLNQYYSDLGYSKKTQIGDDTTFTTSAIGLVLLSNIVYDKLCEISPRFAVCVSSSMFMYYVSQLHYMRLCILEWEVSKPGTDEDRVIYNQIRRNRWIVPQLLADYFNSIGSFKDSAGVPAQHHEIVFPSADNIDGINGFFGRVDSNTHAHYENRISPGVAARRIIEDLNFTACPRENGNWNLPRILVPVEKNAGGPTGNLLGWNLATSLTTEQISILKDCGISFNQGKITFSHCTRFCHNDLLMSCISSHLNELRGKVKCTERLSTITMGSIIQHDFQIVHSYVMPTREIVYGDISTLNCGFTPLHLHQEILAHVFRFRLFRKMLAVKTTPSGVVYNFNTWCCYDFNQFREVPDSWFKTKNLYFLFGGEKAWDMVRFKTPPADLRVFLKGLMTKTLTT